MRWGMARLFSVSGHLEFRRRSGFRRRNSGAYITLNMTISTGIRISRYEVCVRPRPGTGGRNGVIRMADAEVLPYEFTDVATQCIPM